MKLMRWMMRWKFRCYFCVQDGPWRFFRYTAYLDALSHHSGLTGILLCISSYAVAIVRRDGKVRWI